MRIAIMQPYIFPYIGYFQLIHAVDKFILLDNVNFINKGWINRNRILVNGKEFLFTIPLGNASQNKLIQDISIVDDAKWKKKLITTLSMAYKKAPGFSLVFPVIEDIIIQPTSGITAFIFYSLKQIGSLLGIQTDIIPDTTIYNNVQLKGKDKLIDICRQEKASGYINPIGGQSLYNKEQFKENDIDLFFLKTKLEKPVIEERYDLSIIHLLMNHKPEEVRSMLNCFELL